MAENKNNPYLNDGGIIASSVARWRRKRRVTLNCQKGNKVVKPRIEKSDSLDEEQIVFRDKRYLNCTLDPRILQLDASYFAKRSVLEICCGEGLASTTISILYSDSKVVGIDSDPQLIRNARRKHSIYYSRSNAASIIDKNSISDKNEKLQTVKLNYFPMSVVSNIGYMPIAKRDKTLPLFTNIIFRCECLNNKDSSLKFTVDKGEEILSLYELRTYDTIVAFSTLASLHINNNKEDLKNFFRKCYNLLNEGGILICELYSVTDYKHFFKPQRKITERLENLSNTSTDFMLEIAKSVSFHLEKVLNINCDSKKFPNTQIVVFSKKSS